MVCLNRLSVSAILVLSLGELAAAAPIAIREAGVGESTQMAARHLKNPIVDSRDNLEERGFEMLEERDDDDIEFALRDAYTDEIDIDTRAPLAITKLLKKVVIGTGKDLDNLTKVHNDNVKKNQAANKKAKRDYQDIELILRGAYADSIDIDTRAPLAITKLIKKVVIGTVKDLDNLTKVHNDNVKKNQAANNKVKRDY